MTTSATATTTGVGAGRSGIPLSRLIRVEMRKLVDTRAGFWLIASIGLITLAVMIGLLAGNRNKPENLSFGEIFGLMNIPTAIILPVMAILLVTGEWSQRTALTTFAMEPAGSGWSSPNSSPHSPPRWGPSRSASCWAPSALSSPEFSIPIRPGRGHSRPPVS